MSERKSAGEIAAVVFGWLVGTIFIMHIVFWAIYDTSDPCEVAVVRYFVYIGGEDTGTTLAFVHVAFDLDELGKEFKQQFGLVGCYKTAVGGGSVVHGLLAKKFKEARKRKTE